MLALVGHEMILIPIIGIEMQEPGAEALQLATPVNSRRRRSGLNPILLLCEASFKLQKKSGWPMIKPLPRFVNGKSRIRQVNFAFCSRQANVEPSSCLCELVGRLIRPRRKTPLVHAQEKDHFIFQSFRRVERYQVQMVRRTALTRKCRNGCI